MQVAVPTVSTRAGEKVKENVSRHYNLGALVMVTLLVDFLLWGIFARLSVDASHIVICLTN